jgi:hypothetical protein
VLTDNGTCFKRRWAEACATYGIAVRKTRAYRPQTNGKAERFIRTLLERWAYAYPYEHESERLATLEPALDFYNRFRPHRALGGLRRCSASTTSLGHTPSRALLPVSERVSRAHTNERRTGVDLGLGSNHPADRAAPRRVRLQPEVRPSSAAIARQPRAPRFSRDVRRTPAEAPLDQFARFLGTDTVPVGDSPRKAAGRPPRRTAVAAI